ncbi:MAG: hypothetical protein GY809_20505 [Planctomycetes bacterium]|nr:hypothetical protein [Planctomycetota bacterium]
MIYTNDISPPSPIWTYIGTNLTSEDIVHFVQDDKGSRKVACIVKDANYGVSSIGDIYVIDDYTSGGTWTKVLDGTAAWTYLDGIITSLNDAYLVRLYSFNGRLLAVLRYDDGIYVGYWRNYVSPEDNWSSFSLGAYAFSGLSLSPLNELFDWSQYACEIVQLSGGTLISYLRNRVGSNERCVRMQSPDYGLNFTQSVVAHNCGKNHGARNGFALPTSLLPYGNDNLLTLAYCDTDVIEPEPYQNRMWPNATYPPDASIEEYFDESVIETVDEIMRPQQCFVAGTGQYFWGWAHQEVDPDLSGFYGYTRLYYQTGYPTVWNTVNVPIFGLSIDPYLGDPDNIWPANRIVIGNAKSYSSVVGDQSVMLLTEGGTVVANKVGSGIYSLGADKIVHIRFDPFR